VPFAEVNLVPTVNVETTLADNASGVSESNFIRWRGALPEKRGGCILYYNNTIQGTPTDLQPWLGINGEKFLGIGTDAGLFVLQDKSPYNISPQYIDSNSQTPPKFTTYANSSTVRVEDSGVSGTSSNVTIYDSVVFNTPVSIDGLIIFGEYKIKNSISPSPSVYEIEANGLAASGVVNGGVLPEFVTTAGNSSVTCNFPNHNYAVGEMVSFLVPTTVAGITIFGSYIIRAVNPGVSFDFVAENAASSTTTAYMNNNVLNARYWIVSGPVINGSGYGLNGYGEYPYGQGSADPPLTGTQYGKGEWWLDNWGERLISCGEGGPLFEWSKLDGFNNASIINGAPVANMGMFVAMPQQQVMCWGSTYTGQVDPLQIRWSNVGDYADWTPRVTNQAGGYHIPTGSKIVRGIQGQTQQFWFTDIDVYVAQYTGDPFVYSFNKIGSGCGLIAPRAVGMLGGSIYWMSQTQFYVATAGNSPMPIPCSVWDFIFQNTKQGINPESGKPYSDGVVCGTNAMFNEVNWFFTSVDSPDGYPDAYVCYNTQYNMWDYGYMGRTAWYDQSALGPPLAANSQTVLGVQQGYIYQHETSYDLANGLTINPINAYLKTGYFSLSNGQDLSFVDWMLPDMKWDTYALQNEIDGADLQVTFYVTDYTGETPKVYGPYNMNKTTKFISPRFRGRYVSMKIESNDSNSFWRLGSIRYRFAPSGRR